MPEIIGNNIDRIAHLTVGHSIVGEGNQVAIDVAVHDEVLAEGVKILINFVQVGNVDAVAFFHHDGPAVTGHEGHHEEHAHQ